MKRALLTAVVALSSQLGGCAMPLVAAGVATGYAAADVQHPVTHANREDWLIRRELVGRLHADAAIWGAGRLQVNSFNGVVLLSGELSDPRLTARAEQHALATTGVRAVANEVIAGGPPAPAAARQDRRLARQIRRELAEHGVPPERFQLATARGIVYLLGELSAAEATLARQAATDAGALHFVDYSERRNPV